MSKQQEIRFELCSGEQEVPVDNRASFSATAKHEVEQMVSWSTLGNEL